jgi:hypothetical protein
MPVSRESRESIKGAKGRSRREGSRNKKRDVTNGNIPLLFQAIR